NTHLKLKEWILFISGSIIVILSFIWDYLKYIQKIHSSEIVNPLNGEKDLFTDILNYIPHEFNWPLFLTGEIIILCGFVMFVLRIKRYNI
ncbi:MAG: hypothetical protein H0U27_12195, partial [Nitrosopumilus sp.]|nr:hypothetical protein [Nitrosopumilus sp.]